MKQNPRFKNDELSPRRQKNHNDDQESTQDHPPTSQRLPRKCIPRNMFEPTRGERKSRLLPSRLAGERLMTCGAVEVLSVLSQLTQHQHSNISREKQHGGENGTSTGLELKERKKLAKRSGLRTICRNNEACSSRAGGKGQHTIFRNNEETASRIQVCTACLPFRFYARYYIVYSRPSRLGSAKNE